MNYKLLGKRLQAERLKLGLTQAQLAEDIDISEAYIGHIERAERHVSLPVLIKMVDRLGITVDYVLSDSIIMTDDIYIEQLIHLIQDKSDKEKLLILNIVKSVLSYNQDDCENK